MTYEHTVVEYAYAPGPLALQAEGFKPNIPHDRQRAIFIKAASPYQV